MKPNSIKSSGFSLAKESELSGDDFYDIQLFENSTVAIVCDGVSSASKGAEAAKRVTQYLMNNLKIRPKSWSIEHALRKFIPTINSILYEESQLQYERSELVTTLAIVVIQGDRLYGANVGDTRIYLYRDGIIHQRSLDHLMSETGYEQRLTQAIGVAPNITPFYFENFLQKEDFILICSDGLYSLLSENTLETNITLGAYSLVKKASTITHEYLQSDTTAVVLEVCKINAKESLEHQNLTIPSSLEEEQLIDSYLLKKPLAKDKRTWLVSKEERDYVMKMAPIEAANNEAILERFITQMWHAIHLDSSYFPNAEIPENRTYRYYIMELSKGTTLAELIKERRLSTEEIISLATMLLKMAQSLLKQDLVHGDINPQNIMAFEEERGEREFSMIDFGSITDIFSLHSNATSLSFMAPQRLQGEALCESSEIFAIGVTLYLALTGEYPYREIKSFETPRFKEPKAPSFYNNATPPWLDTLILRAISLDKLQRYKHYSEMEYELAHPKSAEPYFLKNTPLIEKSPYIFYKRAFTLMFLLNFMLLYLLLK